MKIILSLLMLVTFSFAVTPFSLENLKGVNFLILDKTKSMDKKLKEELTKKFEDKIQQAGISITTNRYSNLLLKIKKSQVGTTTVAFISLFLIEDVSIKREAPADAIAITFSKEDFFESESFDEDLVDSVDFLLDEFIAQYKEEN